MVKMTYQQFNYIIALLSSYENYSKLSKKDYNKYSKIDDYFYKKFKDIDIEEASIIIKKLEKLYIIKDNKLMN